MNLPKISIVTPSFNQGQFIEQTICSVLDQGYPNLEYIIIDGGSTDNTIDIIRKYESKITYWISEPDSGQADAINKGLSIATGSIFNWINSDDYFAAVDNFLSSLRPKVYEPVMEKQMCECAFEHEKDICIYPNCVKPITYIKDGKPYIKVKVVTDK